MTDDNALAPADPDDFLPPSRRDLLGTVLGVEYADARDYIAHAHSLDPDVHDNMCWFIAWSCMHPQARGRAGLPRFQTEFLRHWLGVDPSCARKWRQKHAWLDAYIVERGFVGKSILEEYRDDIYQAIGESALMLGREGLGDRKLAIELLGDKEPDTLVLDWRNFLPPGRRADGLPPPADDDADDDE